MDMTQQTLLRLLRSALTGVPEQLPGDFEPEQLAELVKAHQLVGLVYEGAINCGVDKNDTQMKQWFQKYYAQMLRHERQMASLKALFDRFEQEGIDYLPMKGVILKPMYPAPAARVMGDADILIRMEQYDRIRPIVEQLGYTEKPPFYHELPWDSKDLHLELHRSVIRSYYVKEYNYFEKTWDRAVHIQGHRYAMCPQDEYLFIFTHYADHYRNGGIGIRQLLDLWLCRKNLQNLDQQKLQEGLEQLGMAQFHEYTQKMLDMWFENGPSDERIEHMTDFIFASGSWGLVHNKLMARNVMNAKQEGSVEQLRSRRKREMFFPPLQQMKRRYKVLEKAPVLLPAMWPVRWVSAALFRRDNIKNYNDLLEQTNQENIESYEDSLRYVGLEFTVEQE